MRTPLAALLLVVASSLGSTAAAPDAGSCCGPITPQARNLERKLDASGVDHLWLPGHHVDWRTGEPNSNAEDNGYGNKSHCSAFAASVADSLGVPLLRPPQHSQILLANAQVRWLDGPQAARDGWRRVDGMREAQALANRGRFVVVTYKNPDPHKPGHIAIVRPSAKSLDELERDGPQVIQAGSENALSTTLRTGFRHHRGAWPDGVSYYEYTRDLAP